MTTPALAILERLVGFDTESSRSNLALQAFVEDYLGGHGITPVRVPNAAGDKVTLFATIGPVVDGGVVLSGHTDVVPVEGQTWSSDPFTLRVTEDRAYGRGSVDMKGFAAIVLSLVPAMLAAPLKRPIHIMLSYDEETTCLGVVDTIARMGHDLPRPGAVIVGEPTNLDIADAHKGVTCFLTTVKGHEAHSSKPHLGANALLGAVDMVHEFERIAADLRQEGDATGRFDPPFATLHVGNLRAGTARNIVPNGAVMEWEIRGVPGTDIPSIVARLERHASEVVVPKMSAFGWPSSVETVCLVDVPGLAPAPGSAAETLALRLAGRNSTITVPYGTEAGHFQRAGIPTVVCGPGSIDQAHQPDEYILLSEIARGEAFIRKLIAECAA
jgi:acetylornithine deacetylase